MNMTSIGIAGFNVNQCSKIMSTSLFEAGLFPKYKKIMCFARYIELSIKVSEKINLNANKI